MPRVTGRRPSHRLPILALVPFSLFLVTGLLGTGYGRHWDEQARIEEVRDGIETGRVLPGSYNYPGMLHWVVYAACLPDAMAGKVLLSGAEGPEARTAWNNARLARVRNILVCLTSLAVIWTYLLAQAWGAAPWACWFAAFALAGSWEVGYHARWTAPDTLMMQFAVLALWLSSRASEPGSSPWWRRLAAVAVGLAAGSKYPGAIVLLPALVAAWKCHDSPAQAAPASLPTRFRRVAVMALIAGATFVITTPGLVLDWNLFATGIRYEAFHYDTAHPGYTVEGIATSFGLHLNYISQFLLSPEIVVALLLFVCSLLGCYVVTVRRAHPIARATLVALMLYFAYFSTRKIIMVRNLLVLTPVLAALAGIGVNYILPTFRRPLATNLLRLLCFILPATGVVWGGRASTHTREDAGATVAEVAAYIRDNPYRRFFLSPLLHNALLAMGQTLPSTALVEPTAAFDETLWLATEYLPPYAWPGTAPFFLSRWFGPKDVNFRWYPTWIGSQHVVAMDAETFRTVDRRILLHNAVRQSLAIDRPYIALGLVIAWQKIFPKDLDAERLYETLRKAMPSENSASGETPALPLLPSAR